MTTPRVSEEQARTIAAQKEIVEIVMRLGNVIADAITPTIVESQAALLAGSIGAEIDALKAALAEGEKVVEAAMTVLNNYSQIDGAHHKAWCLDQVARALMGDGYSKWRELYENNGEYGWDEGTAP